MFPTIEDEISADLKRELVEEFKLSNSITLKKKIVGGLMCKYYVNEEEMQFVNWIIKEDRVEVEIIPFNKL